MNNKQKQINVVIIGAGPAGLAAAYELVNSKNSKRFNITIIDKNDRVGGLARTESFQNCLFDVGPHRFYTKNTEVLKLWKKILGKEFLKVKRLTRMLYQDKLFMYPISMLDVLKKLSLIELVEVFFSFLQAKIFLRDMAAITFEDYIVKHFGRKMFNMFFKTYTEKIWGIKCNRIAAKWASQRIKNLNLWEILKASVKGTSKAKSLVEEFYYPTKGAGYMYETLAKILTKKGVRIILNSSVTNMKRVGNTITGVTYVKNHKQTILQADNVLSSMPLTNFVFSLSPSSPRSVAKSAKEIFFRDHITVNLIVQDKTIFKDNWIYIHDPNVRMARVTNYNSMSSSMSKDLTTTAVSVEYFAFRKEAIWGMKDVDLIKLAVAELKKVKLLNPNNVIDGFVVRELDSYPVYYTGHEKYFEKVKSFVASFDNLELIGRGGMFKYNNMDHSIYSGILGARNISLGKRRFDPWLVNEDAEYLELQK